VATLRRLSLRYSARAKSQLLAIREYIVGQGNPDAAARVGAGIRSAADVLRHFPYAGRPGRVSGTREWVVRQSPYIIVYEVHVKDRNEVMILGVFHCRQSPK
jgi:toxin ParE1/3/4